MGLVQDRRALVTGGGTGIGFGIARRLLEEGARVTIVGRREEVLQDAVERLGEAVAGAPVDYRLCDVTVEEQVEAAVAAAAGDAGLDILVANAGSGFPGPIMELDPTAWRYCSDLNILGTALSLKHAGRAMKEKGGSIVTISSTSGIYHDKWMSPYGATKAAVNHLTQTAAMEFAPFNIRVNAIAPGYVPTEATIGAFSDELVEDCVQRTLLKRAGKPEDLGDAVLFLASDLSAWVTGQVLGVDGGLSVHQGSDFGEVAKMVVGEEAMKSAGYKGWRR